MRGLWIWACHSAGVSLWMVVCLYMISWYLKPTLNVKLKWLQHILYLATSHNPTTKSPNYAFKHLLTKSTPVPRGWHGVFLGTGPIWSTIVIVTPQISVNLPNPHRALRSSSQLLLCLKGRGSSSSNARVWLTKRHDSLSGGSLATSHHHHGKASSQHFPH